MTNNNDDYAPQHGKWCLGCLVAKFLNRGVDWLNRRTDRPPHSEQWEPK